VEYREGNMMNLNYRDIEDIDNEEEYEMVPLESVMSGYGQMNTMPFMGMNPNVGMNPSMGMPMGYMQDENMDMNPNRDINAWMGMQQGMGMNQFNEDTSMNGFNPIGMMYGDALMDGYEDEGSRQQDMYLNKDSYNSQNRFNPKYNEVDSIVRKIERYNPQIFRLLTRCKIPYAGAKGLVRRIVRLTLMYSGD
jgi:hypothetical protein